MKCISNLVKKYADVKSVDTHAGQSFPFAIYLRVKDKLGEVSIQNIQIHKNNCTQRLSVQLKSSGTKMT